jgi:hypothetical protein
MNMTSEDPDAPWEFDDRRTMSHPEHPLIDDQSAGIVEDATVELTLRRSPMHLGDGLADLHAMVSLQAQLQAWIPLAVAAAQPRPHMARNRKPTPGLSLHGKAPASRIHDSPARPRLRQSAGIHTHVEPGTPNDGCTHATPTNTGVSEVSTTTMRTQSQHP